MRIALVAVLAAAFGWWRAVDLFFVMAVFDAVIEVEETLRQKRRAAAKVAPPTL